MWNSEEANKQTMKDELMTEEQKEMAKKFVGKYKTLYAENQSLFELWDKCEAAYRGQSSEYWDENEIMYDTINIIHPNIEGQVAQLVEQNIGVTARGEGPSDQNYSHIGRILIDWCLDKNNIKRHIETHERRREKFSSGLFKVHFDPKAINGFGLAKIETPSLKRVFIDGKIKDYIKLQDADYIIETMTKSITWARDEYGDKYADAIFTGIDPETLEGSSKEDDSDTFTLLQVWTMEKELLKMYEITGDGLFLPDKNKDGKPFYKYNKYPYFLTPLYPIEGELYGMGDAELLMPLQALINDLDDQINRNNALNGNPRTYVDPDSDIDLDKITDEEGQFIPCNNPHQNILFQPAPSVSESVVRRKMQVFDEAQRVTRFSDLMIGQGQGATATETNIQLQQGNTGIDHKKQMLQITLKEVCQYLLSLMMEHYTEAKAFRITEDKNDFEWIDPRELNNIPVLKPATEGYRLQMLQSQPHIEAPMWEPMTDEQGQPLTKEVELDIDITIGAGLPKNKSFLFTLVKELAVLAVGGQPVLSYQEVRTFLKDLIDLPLEEIEQQQPELTPDMIEQLQGQMPEIPSNMPGQPTMPDYTVEGQTAGGNPQGVMPSV